MTSSRFIASIVKMSINIWLSNSDKANDNYRLTKLNIINHEFKSVINNLSMIHAGFKISCCLIAEKLT